MIRSSSFHAIMRLHWLFNEWYRDICLTLEVVHTKNTVPYLFSRKTVSRALRGHQILDLGLNNNLLDDLLPELDGSFSFLENTMPDAKNGWLNNDNAVKCNILKALRKCSFEKK